MTLNLLTFHVTSSGIDIVVLGILIALLNVRSLSLATKTRFLIQLRSDLILGIIPILLVSILIMIKQLIAAIANT